MRIVKREISAVKVDQIHPGNVFRIKDDAATFMKLHFEVEQSGTICNAVAIQNGVCVSIANDTNCYEIEGNFVEIVR